MGDMSGKKENNSLKSGINLQRKTSHGVISMRNLGSRTMGGREGMGGEPTRTGYEREGVLGQGLLLTECSCTRFRVSYLCWQFATLDIRTIGREMLMGVFLRREGATRHCNNFLGFLSLLVLSTASPCHRARSCPAFGVFYTLLRPRSWFWDLRSKMRLRCSITVWELLLSLQTGSKERRKTRCKHGAGRGDCCETPSFSCTGSPPARQRCEFWDGGNGWAGKPAISSSHPRPHAHRSIHQDWLHCNGWDLFHGNTSGNWTGISPPLMTV